MHKNYQKLFEELTDLVSDQKVQANLDISLKARVNRLIDEKGRPQRHKKVSELNRNDSEPLFGRQSYDGMSNVFEKIVLKESDSCHKLSAKGQVTGGRLKNNKPVQNGGFRKQKMRERMESNSSKILREISRKNSKEIAQGSKRSSVSKQKPRLKSKESFIKCLQTVEKQIEARERSRSKTKEFDKNNRQNFKIYPKKDSSSSHQKTEPCSEHSYFTYSKNKSNTSGREVLKIIATNQIIPSRFSVSSSKKGSLSLEKQKKILLTIEQKKQEVTEQKILLQDTIKMLQIKINKEKSLMGATEGRTAKIRQDIARFDLSQKERSIEVRISRKKSQSFLTETRQIQDRIIQANKYNDTVEESIVEEQYLIEMYQKVIDEMKNQLKVEKDEKSGLKKKLNLLRKSQKMVAERYESRQALSDQLFSSMQESLNKWI